MRHFLSPSSVKKGLHLDKSGFTEAHTMVMYFSYVLQAAEITDELLVSIRRCFLTLHLNRTTSNYVRITAGFVSIPSALEVPLS